MMRYLAIILLLASTTLYAQRGNKPIQEDLASIRPHYTPPPDTGRHYQGNPARNVPVVQPKMTVNDKVNTVLDSIDQLNLLRKVIPGYTIQVYSGLNREEAGETRTRLQNELGMRAELQYIQPKFRVRVGNYFTSIDAQKDLVRLKKVFPNSILVPENIPLR